MFTIHTLGRFELTRSTPGEPDVRILGAGKPLALLTYLALSPKRSASREHLVSLLWRDKPEDRARGTLRQTVWSLRQLLGAEALHTTDDQLILTEPVVVECREFEAAVAAQDHEEAWQRYTGDFLPAFSAAGGLEFEQWADLRRDRLRHLWLTLGEARARRLLDQGATADAIQIARQLLQSHEDHEPAWRLLITGLLEAGDLVQARLEADALAKHLETEQQRPRPETRALLDRVRTPSVSEPQMPDVPTLRPGFVGRDAQLATLIGAWKTSCRKDGSLCIVRGEAGLGKSRLLEEAGDRLERLGATVVSVRARQVDRDVPFAFAAALAEEFAALPGAAGLSPASAGILVELAPALANTYPRSGRDSFNRADLPRLRALALAELAQAVSFETPIAVFIDDLHWADEPSRQLVSMVADRLRQFAVLMVVGHRPIRGGWAAPSHAMAVNLPPLDAAQIMELVHSMGSSTADLDAVLAPALLHASAGVPFLVIAALSLAMDAQTLVLSHGRWAVPDIDRLRHQWSQGSVLEQLLRQLPVGALDVIGTIALLHDAADVELLTATMERNELHAILADLEQRGVLAETTSGWTLTHDAYGEGALRALAPARMAELARLLADAVLDLGPLSAHRLQQAGQLYTLAGSPHAARCFHRWLRLQQQARLWRDPMEASAQFLGPRATVQDAARLTRRISLGHRLLFGYPVVSGIAVVVLLGVVAATAITALRPLFEPTASSFIVEEPTTSNGFLWDSISVPRVVQGNWHNRVPLRVLFRSADGRPTRNTPGTVRVQLVDRKGSVRLTGATSRRVSRGEAYFGDLAVEGSGSFQLEVSADGLPTTRTRRLFAEGGGGDSKLASITIMSGIINGTSVDSLHREIRVRPGARLEGGLRLRTLTASRTAAMLVGAVALWGDHRRGWITLSAAPPHGTYEFTTDLSDRIDNRTLFAPLRAGRYALVLVMDAETQMQFIASRTNWMLGAPLWDDGNDVADIPEEALAQLDANGNILWPKRIRLSPAGNGIGPIQNEAMRLIGVRLTVVVE